MPISLSSPAVRAWASEWADVYDQKITEEEIVALVGKTVDAHAEDSEGKPKGFKEKVIIGFSTDKVFFKNEDDDDAETLFALRRSLVTADGMQFAILSGMTISESQSEDGEDSKG